MIERLHTGRRKISSHRDDRVLIRMALADRHQTAASLRQKWNVNASLSTVKSRLRAANLKGCVATRKPMLKASHRFVRVTWCRDKWNWSVVPWENFILTNS